MKVMIVDDEIRVGNLIKNLIDWERLGLELAGVYQNGFDVLERFQHEPADILLCDIEMPEITGIELIQRISAEYPATKCIIVSGFRNFEYARQAMRYGVDYYILKPIDEDELNNTLSIICKATAEEWEKTRLERNSLLLAVQNGSYQPMSLPEINKRQGFTFAEGAFFYVKIVASSEESLEEVLTHLMARVPLVCNDVIFFGRDKHTASALVNLNRSTTKEGFMSLLQEAAAQGKTQPLYLFVGPDFTDVRNLAEENARVNRAAWQRLFLQKTGAYPVETGEKTGTVKLTESENNCLMKAVENMDKDMLSKLIRGIFYDRLQQLKEAPYLVESVAEIVAMSVFNKLYNLGVRANDFSATRDGTAEKLETAKNLDDIVRCLADSLYTDIRSKLVVYTDEESDYVRQAKNYILKNYNRGISLESLAEELRLNQSYVSSVFKEGTGINFKQFLTDVRMDNAKRLLRETNMNVSQIACEVGYKSAFYFTNTFVAHEGIKPQEYRRMHRSFR